MPWAKIQAQLKEKEIAGLKALMEIRKRDLLGSHYANFHSMQPAHLVILPVHINCDSSQVHSVTKPLSDIRLIIAFHQKLRNKTHAFFSKFSRDRVPFQKVTHLIFNQRYQIFRNITQRIRTACQAAAIGNKGKGLCGLVGCLLLS